MRHIERWGRRSLAAVLLVLVIWLLPRFSGASAAEWLAEGTHAPLLSGLMLLGLYAVKTVIMLCPVTVLNICVGLLFPPVPAVLVALGGNVIELSIGYGMGHFLGRERVAARLQKSRRVARFLERQRRHDATSCFLCRLLPLPLEPCSLFFGAMGVPFGRYLSASALGIFPRMLPWVIAVGAIDRPLSGWFLVPFLLSACLTISVFLLLRRWQRRVPQYGSVQRFLSGEE